MKNTVIVLKDLQNDENMFPIVQLRETSSVEVIDVDDTKMIILGFVGGPIPGHMGFDSEIIRTIRGIPSQN